MKLRGLVDRDTVLPNAGVYHIRAGEEIAVDDGDEKALTYWREVAAGGAAVIVEDETFKPEPPPADADEAVWREFHMRVAGASVAEANKLSRDELVSRYRGDEGATTAAPASPGAVSAMTMATPSTGLPTDTDTGQLVANPDVAEAEQDTNPAPTSATPTKATRTRGGGNQ